MQAIQISKAFGARDVLQDVSFRAGRGERLAVVGRNGEGKTTLLRILAGRLPADGGSVSLPRGATVALHDQRPPLGSSLTLEQYVAEGMADAQRAEAFLTRLRAVPEFLDGVLSRHRAGLAAGRTPVAHLVRGAIAHLDRYLADPANDPLLRQPGHVWVNLQYGDVGTEIAQLAERHGIAVHRDPEIDPTQNLDGLAAQIAALDAVVSSSNSTVHLAGALGRPCHVLLPAGRGRMWYWPREGETSPWYASIRLLRQQTAGDWSAVVTRAIESLRADG